MSAAIELGDNTVHSLLEASTLLSGRKIHPRLGSCNIQMIVNDAVTLSHSACPPKPHVIVTSTLDPDLPTNMVTDAAWVQRMVINLMTNALKFTTQGSINVTVRSSTPDEIREHACLQEDLPHVTFIVHDTDQ